MPNLSNKDIAEIEKLILDGYLSKTYHSTIKDIYILNYTNKTQWEWYWNEYTIQCRGLVIEETTNKIVALPIPKFFHYNDELQFDIYKQDFEIWEKMDGVLGIIFNYNNEWHISTRGKFDSPYAKLAKELLDGKNLYSKLDKRFTYCVEIIHPETRIIVDYVDRKDLVLLAIIETDTRKEFSIETHNPGFSLPKKFILQQPPNSNDLTTIETIQFGLYNLITSIDGTNKEGYIIKYFDGNQYVRLKIKYEEYVMLHKLLLNLNGKVVYKALVGKQVYPESVTIEELIALIPDELYDWLSKTIENYKTKFNEIEELAINELTKLKDFQQHNNKEFTKKEQAEYILKNCTHPHICFDIINNRNYSKHIWKLIEPQENIQRLIIDEFYKNKQ